MTSGHRSDSWALVTVSALAMCLVAPAFARAQTVYYVTQERRIAASNREVFFTNDPPDQVVLGDFQEAAAPDLGPFDAAVEAQAHDERFHGGYSRVSQHSLLGPDGIRISGEWSNYAATGEGSFAFETLADVTFEVVDAPVGFTLAYSLRDPSTRGFDRRVDLFLRHTDGGGTDVFRVASRYDLDTYTASGVEHGTLSPGQYEFRFNDSYFGDVGEFGPYNVRLSLGTVPEPTSAALLLGGGILAMGQRRRR